LSGIIPLTAKSRRFTATFRRNQLFLIVYSCSKGKKKGGACMKRFRGKQLQLIATLALVVTIMVSNSACLFIAHQEPLPEKAKQLRRF